MPALHPLPSRLPVVFEAPPQHGRVIVVGNSFAYVPNPGYVGSDRFAFDATATMARDIPMRGEMLVTVR